MLPRTSHSSNHDAARMPVRTNSPSKKAPEGEGWRKLLPIVEAVDHTERIRHLHPHTLTEPVQIRLFCPGPGIQKRWREAKS